MLERAFESYVVDYCRRHNVLCYKFTSPARRGVPDRVLIFPGGITVFVELKTETGQLSKLQEHEIALLRKQGAEVRVFYGVVDFLKWIRPITNQC